MKDNVEKLLVSLEPVEFLGVARILGVELLDEEKNPLPFESVFSAVLQKYGMLSRSQRRNLLKILRPAVKKD